MIKALDIVYRRLRMIVAFPYKFFNTVHIANEYWVNSLQFPIWIQSHFQTLSPRYVTTTDSTFHRHTATVRQEKTLKTSYCKATKCFVTGAQEKRIIARKNLLFLLLIRVPFFIVGMENNLHPHWLSRVTRPSSTNEDANFFPFRRWIILKERIEFFIVGKEYVDIWFRKFCWLVGTYHRNLPPMKADGWYRWSLLELLWQIFVKMSIHSFSSTQLFAWKRFKHNFRLSYIILHENGLRIRNSHTF